MIAKFAELLNTKKLKIRDQQRLLAHAIVDPATAAQVTNGGHAASGTKTKRSAAASRTGKRKASIDTAIAEPGSDLEPTGRGEDQDELMREEMESSDGSNRDATDDEDSDAEGFAPAPSTSQVSRSGAGNRGKDLQAPEPAKDDAMPEIKEAPLPPRRALPFSKRSTERPTSGTPSVDQAKTQTAKPAGDDEDDDETDDEL